MNPLLLLLLVVCQALATDPDIILKPQAGKTGPTSVLVYIPGGDVPNNNYTLTAKAIQTNSELDLWVVIPGVFNRLCIIECSGSFACAPLYNTINGALGKAVAAGMPQDAEQHLAGHSLGGTCANYLVQGYKNNTYKSLMVMGSYVDETGGYTLDNYPIPVATIGGELDGGMARPGKLALWVEQFNNYSKTAGGDIDKALSTKPVIIINSIDHSDFCPGFAVPGDLKSELDQPAASSAIGQIAGAYLNIRAMPSGSQTVQTSLSILKKGWASTQVLTDPVLKTLAMEVDNGNGMFVPGRISPWCNTAQLQLSGVSAEDQKKISLINDYEKDDLSFEHTRVKYQAEGGMVVLNISSHASYSTDVANTGTYISAQEIGCKLANYDRIAQQLNTTAVATAVQCRAVNELALNTALALASPRTLARYKQEGKQVCFVDDTTVVGNVGPLWIFSRLKMTVTDKCLSVQSLKLQTFVDGKIMPGVHYCKLLSPARILDWIMTDSLKGK